MPVTKKNPTTAEIRLKAAEMHNAAHSAEVCIMQGHHSTARELVNICRFAATDLIVMLNDEVPND